MIKIYTQSQPWSSALDFYIVEQDDINHKKYLLSFAADGIRLIELPEFSEIKNPSFRLSSDYAIEFLKGMAECANEKGIKLESDLKREGKLEAVKEHLEDMRKLVFKETK